MNASQQPPAQVAAMKKAAVDTELVQIRQQLAMLGTGTTDVPDSVLLNFIASVQASRSFVAQCACRLSSSRHNPHYPSKTGTSERGGP